MPRIMHGGRRIMHGGRRIMHGGRRIMHGGRRIMHGGRRILVQYIHVDASLCSMLVQYIHVDALHEVYTWMHCTWMHCTRNLNAAAVEPPLGSCRC
jgi:hypothetical protein